MIDNPEQAFSELAATINKVQSGFVQFANYMGYFLMAIPAGIDRAALWL